MGRAKDTPYEIKPLNINAEGLTYMKMLQNYKFTMTYEGGIGLAAGTGSVYTA